MPCWSCTLRSAALASLLAPLLALLAACPRTGNHSDAGVADAEPLPPAPPPSHLLLTEVYSQIAMYELVEIYNPTDAAIALDDYYLADDALYAQLAALDQPGAPAIAVSDFIVGFPAGAAIEAGGVVVVALDGVGFASFFPAAADYAIDAPGASTPMRRVAVGADAQLSDQGEMIVLFRWEGIADRVQDIDLVLAGIPQASNRAVDKSAIAVDGPDGDAVPSEYAADAATIPVFDDVTSDAHSYKRIALEGLAEAATGGNGITGHDETSEQTSVTWGQGLSFSAPTPGVVPVLAEL